MKKKQLAALLMGMILMLTPLTAFAAPRPITVTIDGQEVEFPDQGPVIVNNRTLVPVYGVFKALGWEADWDRATSTALLSRGNMHISIQIGAPTFSVFVYDPDSPHPGHASIGMLYVPAQIIGGRTMLPLGPLLQSIGYGTDWCDDTRTVIITSPPTPLIFTIEEEYHGATAAALELIYEDEYTRYYLSSMRSMVIMLTFEDGTRMSLREALDEEKVTIADLLYNGLDVITKSNLPPTDEVRHQDDDMNLEDE